MEFKTKINAFLDKKVTIKELEDEIYGLYNKKLDYFKDVYDLNIIKKSLNMYKRKEISLGDLIDWFKIHISIIAWKYQRGNEFLTNLLSDETKKTILQDKICSLMVEITLMSDIFEKEIDEILYSFKHLDKMIKNVNKLEVIYSYFEKDEEVDVEEDEKDVEAILVLFIDNQNKTYIQSMQYCLYEEICVVPYYEQDNEINKLDIEGYTDLSFMAEE